MSKEAKPTHYLVAITVLLAISLLSFTSVYSAPTETNQTSFWKTIYCNTIGDWFNSPNCPLREDIDMVEYNTVTLVDDESSIEVNNTDTYKTQSNPPSINKITVNRDSPTTISPTNTQTPTFDLSILNNYVTKDYLSLHNSNTNSSDYVTRDFLSRQVGAIGDSFGRSLSDLSTRLTALIPSAASITNWDSFFTTPSTRILAGTNLSWDGNTLNAVGSSGGVSLSLSNNIFGQSSLTPTTTQNLAISGTGTSTFSGGLESWRQISSPYFNATSTTATSTFSGGLIAGGSTGLTVLQNGNVGVGTATPWTKLGVNGTADIGSLYISDSLVGPGADEKNAVYINMPTVTNNIARGVNTVMNWSGTYGATGYNLFGYITGSGDHNHYYGNQNWIFHDSAGTTTNVAAFMGKITQNAGKIENWYGLYLPSNTLTSGSITNSWNIYSTNEARSYLRGGLILSDSLITPSASTVASYGVLRISHDYATISGGLSKHGIYVLSTDTASVGAGGVIALGGESGAASTPYPFGLILGAKEQAGATYNGYLAFYTTDTGSNNSEKMRLTSAGNIGIGTTSPFTKLSVAGNAYIGGNLTATGTVTFDNLTASTGAGSICLSATKELVYNAGSDACLPSLRSTKHDITNLSTSSLSTLNLLTPVSFIYNQGDNRTRYGFIAEDVSQIDTHLATYNDKGEISGIDDRALIALAIGSIKELDIKIRNIITSVGEWVFNKITATLGVFERVETKTFESESVKSNSVETKGIQMTDKVTGQVYCISLSGGNLDKSIGPCSTATTTTVISPTPTPDSTPTPSVTPISNLPTPTPIPTPIEIIDINSTTTVNVITTTPTSTPTATSTTVVESVDNVPTPTPSPDLPTSTPKATPVPETIPTVEPVETVSREPVNNPVAEPSSEPVSESVSP